MRLSQFCVHCTFNIPQLACNAMAVSVPSSRTNSKGIGSTNEATRNAFRVSNTHREIEPFGVPRDT